MPGVDKFLSQYLRIYLQSKLGKTTTKAIEDELNSWYQIDLEQSMMEFGKFNKVLGNVYGKKPAHTLVKNVVENIMTFDSEHSHVKIVDTDIVQMILSTLGDVVNRKIITLLQKEELSMDEIVRNIDEKISEQSIYRKMDSLQNIGLIIESGTKIGTQGRKIKTFSSIFSTFDVSVNNDKMEIRSEISSPQIIEESMILECVYPKVK